MKVLPMSVIVLLLGINFFVSPSSGAETSPASTNSEPWEVGQKVIWLYKARADSANVHKVPAEIIKLGSKQVQIKFRKNNNEFVNRWVNRNRLETITFISPPGPEL
jgi:hypothetical protein